MRSELKATVSQARRAIERQRQAHLVKSKRRNGRLESTVGRRRVDTKRSVLLICQVERRAPPESCERSTQAERADVVGVGVVAAELLRRDRISRQRCLLLVADVAVIPFRRQHQRGAGAGAILERGAPFDPLLANPVAPARRYSQAAADPLQESRTKREAFDTVEPRQIGYMPRREREAATAGKRLLADERAGLFLHLSDILVGDRTDIRRQRIKDVADKRKRFLRLLGRGRLHDFRSGEIARRNALVHLIAADLPASADDPSRGVVEPRTSTPDLDLLAAWQPEPTLDERVFEHHRYVLEILVDQRRAGKAKGHPHHFARLAIDVD